MRSRPILFRLIIASCDALFLVFLSILAANPALAEPVPRFGLWVEVEGDVRPFDTLAGYQNFQDYVAGYKFTDLYCQVYRGGRSWFPSLMADATPYYQARSQGFDPLRGAIDAAHARGQRIHAWVNVLRLFHNPEAPLLKVVGREAAVGDNYGNSILDYGQDGRAPGALGAEFRLGTPGIWLEASVPRVRQYVVETIRDLIIAYPDLDGIHLDMVRYPMAIRNAGGLASRSRPRFGFGRESVRRYLAFGGDTSAEITPQLIDKLQRTESWHTWQRAQVTFLVFEIRELMNQMAPRMELSAAVIADANRAHNEMYQDWPQWLSGKIVDSVVLMSYTTDTSVVRAQSRKAVQVSSHGQVLIGLAAWLMKNRSGLLVEQGNSALGNGSDGVVLFSYSNLFSKPGRDLVERFTKSAFPAL